MRRRSRKYFFCLSSPFSYHDILIITCQFVAKYGRFSEKRPRRFSRQVRDPCQHNTGNHWSSPQAEQILTDRFLSLRAASFGPHCSQWAETGLRSFCLSSKLSPESIWLRPPNFLGIN